MHGYLVELILASPRLVMHPEDVKQRRFPCSGRTHDRNKLAGLDVEIDSPQDIVLRDALGKRFVDVAQADH